ncbi:MAG TPA: HigA family addiction module antitoxin [Terriglobales bacterium]|nr:HigA family addiction module antitoxin [Terriglobales bacterium]
MSSFGFAFDGTKATLTRSKLSIITEVGSTMVKRNKVFAIHPGEILREEFMRPLNISAYKLAKALKFPGIYEVVRGDRAISADTAIRLSRYFGLPPQFWLNLQNDYDLRLAQRGGAGEGIKPYKSQSSTSPTHEIANF